MIKVLGLSPPALPSWASRPLEDQTVLAPLLARVQVLGLVPRPHAVARGLACCQVKQGLVCWQQKVLLASYLTSEVLLVHTKTTKRRFLAWLRCAHMAMATSLSSPSRPSSHG